MKKLNIAISGINATDNPGPGIPVAKSLRESDLDCHLIGLSYDINDPGNYLTDFIDSSFILPYPTKGWEGIEAKLEYINEKVGIDAVIPCLDAELPLYIKYSSSLKNMGIKSFLPDMASFELRNKVNLADIAKTLNTVYPETHKVYSLEELNKTLKDKTFPLMVKGQYYRAYIVRYLDEAIKYFNSISEEWGFPILVQEVVKGEELNIVGVGDGKGGHLGMVAMRKQSTTGLGKVWSAVTIHHKALMKTAEDFIRKYKWQGPFELEYIVDGNTIQLIEINPRFPAWVYFATGIGVNLPERLIKLILGMPYDTESDYQSGKFFMRFTDEVVTDMDLFSSLVTNGERDVK